MTQSQLALAEAHALSLDDSSLQLWCQNNKTTATVCGNDTFWFRRLRLKGYQIPSDPPLTTTTYRNIYNKLSSGETVNDLLEYAAETNKQDVYELAELLGADDYSKAIRAAASKKNIMLVNEIISDHKDETNFNEGLLGAAQSGSIPLVDLMIKNGAINLNKALTKASERGRLQAVAHLVDLGADDLSLPLETAAENNHYEVVELLVELGAPDLDDALSAAVREGHVDIAEYLLDNGASDVNNALIDAAEGGHGKAVELLVRNGATKFKPAIEAAREEGHGNIVRYLEGLRARKNM